MEKLFELTFQDQTLNPQVGTYTNTTGGAGTFTLEDGEYYLTNGGAEGFYTYAPIAIQPDSGTDNKITVEFDLKVLSVSALTHAVLGSFDQLDINDAPVQTCWLINYSQGDIEFAHSGGSAVTLIAAADVVVDQWYHFKIECSKGASSSTFDVDIDGSTVATITSTASSYKFDILAVLGTGLHACDECGIKNIRFITDDDYFVGRTALNQVLRDTKGYVDNQVGACIPRAGGPVISGTELARIDNTGYLALRAGTNYENGGALELFGKGHSLYAGYASLKAQNSSNYSQMTIQPGGIFTFDNNGISKNIAMQEDTVPRSGGAVMTGDLFRNNDTGEFNIGGGTSSSSGAVIAIEGANSSVPGAIIFQPGPSSPTKNMFIYPDGSWTWNGTACVVSSDRRIKDEIESIPDEVLDAWENLEPKQYKLKSDLENDKDDAQAHYGWIAQDVESVIKGDRKGDVKSGLWLRQSWDEQEEVSHEETYTEEVQTKDGTTETVTKTRKVIDQPYRAKGDSYGLRYDECLVVECKYLRRCIARLTVRIEELEKGKEQETTK